MNDLTRILSEIDAGEATAAARLLELVYDELRRIAAVKLASEKPGQTLQATALVHEAYLRLVDGDTDQQWSGRGHFFAAAAEAMRRILVEHARRKASIKGGGGRHRIDLSAELVEDRQSEVDVIAVSEALDRLHAHDARKAEVVKLRYFAGLDVAETAAALQLSEATVKRDWTYARVWLFRELNASDDR